MPPDRQPASIGFGELKPLSTQLAAKDPVFFDQIRPRLAFLTIHLASQDGQHHLERGRVDHGGSLNHGATMGHYGHSRRIEPIRRSTYGFCHGLAGRRRRQRCPGSHRIHDRHAMFAEAHSTSLVR